MSPRRFRLVSGSSLAWKTEQKQTPRLQPGRSQGTSLQSHELSCLGS